MAVSAIYINRFSVAMRTTNCWMPSCVRGCPRPRRLLPSYLLAMSLPSRGNPGHGRTPAHHGQSPLPRTAGRLIASCPCAFRSGVRPRTRLDARETAARAPGGRVPLHGARACKAVEADGRGNGGFQSPQCALELGGNPPMEAGFAFQ